MMMYFVLETIKCIVQYIIIAAIIKLVMKDPEKSSRKHINSLRKHSISDKTRSDNSNPFAPKEDPFSPFMARGMKSLGRKYAQQNLFKTKQKQHHQIVISDEVVRNSKLFRMLRQKIQLQDAMFAKECNQIFQAKSKLKQEITQIKSNSYNNKLSLWELKNQILQLKGILNDQQQENKRLETELIHPNNNYYPGEEGEEQMVNLESQEDERYKLNSEENMGDHLKQQQIDVRMVRSDFNHHININPENEPFDKEDEDDQIE